jgi:hypothetical protein
MKNKWLIKTYDLFDGEEKDEFYVTGVKGDHQRDLFWISVGIILRWMREQGYLRNAKFPTWRNFVLPKTLFEAAIVHIGEQGKERNLVKCSAILSWMYGPGMKALSRFLSRHKEHKTGLTGSSDAWDMEKRISPLSAESAFMYTKGGSKKTRPNIWTFDMDLKESTDFAERDRGTTHLHALMRYSAFPRWYGNMIIRTFRQPMTVTEEICIDEGFVTSREQFYGIIQEGAMMGQEPTKCILHCTHLRASAWASIVLTRLGYTREFEDGSGEPCIPREREVYPFNPQIS